MPFVVDASVALSWCFRDEDSDYAARILRRLVDDSAIVPAIWPLEIANGLLVAQRRGRLSEAELGRVHELLVDLPIVVAEVGLDEALGSVAALARARNLSAYDASYLDLAVRHGLPLASQDARLIDAAAQVGIQVVD